MNTSPVTRSDTTTPIPTPTSITATVTFSYSTLPADTADKLRKQAKRIKDQVKKTTAAIIEIGRDLISVKQALEHGQFSDWVQAECGFDIRTAQRYISAADLADGKYDTVSLLAPTILYKLAAKATPPEIVADVIERTASGEVVSLDAVKGMLSEAGHGRRQIVTKGIARTESGEANFDDDLGMMLLEANQGQQVIKKRSKREQERREAGNWNWELLDKLQELEDAAHLVDLDIIHKFGKKIEPSFLGALRDKCNDVLCYLAEMSKAP